MTDPVIARRPSMVVAFGGNALLTADDEGTTAEQMERAEAAAAWLSELVERGWRLVLVHGNGPQVGQIMLQMEAAVDRVPPGSMDQAVAETQGGMGYLLELALRNQLAERGLATEPACLMSLVVVDPDDPGFDNPTKPVGPYFPEASARTLTRKHGWEMASQGDAGHRRLVPSPRPLEIVNLTVVGDLLDDGRLVIAGGGGGVPVVRRGDRLVGVEAVIDKDHTASLLGRGLEADLLLILTGVERVYRDFGTPEESPLDRLTASETRQLLEAGQFPPGSMGPKMAAAIDFVEATGKPVVVTDIDHVQAAVAGEAGTRVVPDPPAGSGPDAPESTVHEL